MEPLSVVLSALGGVITGAAAATYRANGDANPSKRAKYSGPRYPSHWPSQSEWLDNPGRVDSLRTYPSPQEAALAGAIPLGRTLLTSPNLVPNRYGLRELRRKFFEARTEQIFLPESSRFRHIAVMGITGGGKSTAFIYNWLAYDALAECSNVVIDVKSPEFFNVLYGPYRKNGKEVLLIDAWNPETLGFEPLYRSKQEELDRLASIIMSYSPNKGQTGGDKNSEYFEQQSEKLLRSLMELATHWPRRYCNLPCVQQMVAAGGQTILEAYKWARENAPTASQVVSAAKVLLEAPNESILGSADPMTRGLGRPPEIEAALMLLDRCGYDIQSRVRELRSLWPETQAENRNSLIAAFEKQVERTTTDRRQRLERFLINIGDFLQSPEETRNSVIASLANKLKPFAKPEIARLFSRDEADLETLIRKPTLLVIGTPLGELPTGAGFVGNILSTLTVKLVENRQVRYNAGERDLDPRLPVHLVLDELPQLGIKQLPTYLATLRSFRCGIICVYQDRAQLEMAYGADVKTIEQNCATKILLPGLYGETPKFISDTVLGTTRVVRTAKRKSKGSDGSVVHTPEQADTMPRMGADDVSQMRINGEVMDDAALQVGLPAPFPFTMTQYWNDSWVRNNVYQMHRTENRGKDGRLLPFWKRLPIFSDKRERWDPTTRNAPYLIRRTVHPDERRDPLVETVEFLLKTYLAELDEANIAAGGTPRRADPLVAPQIDLKDIGASDIDLGAILAAQQAAAGIQPEPTPAANTAPAAMGGLPQMPPPHLPPQPLPSSILPTTIAPSTSATAYPFEAAAGPHGNGISGSSPSQTAMPITRVMPRYSVDFRDMVNDESAQVESILSPGDVPGETIHDYLRALDEMLFGSNLDSDMGGVDDTDDLTDLEELES